MVREDALINREDGLMIRQKGVIVREYGLIIHDENLIIRRPIPLLNGEPVNPGMGCTDQCCHGNTCKKQLSLTVSWCQPGDAFCVGWFYVRN